MSHAESKKRGAIIGVVNLKGGVGKTTIAQTIAMYFLEHTDRKNVLIVDADPQGSSVKWAEIAVEKNLPAPRIQGLTAAPKLMIQELLALREERDLVVVDCPARLGESTRAAMAAADLLLMPVTPGPAEVWAVQDTLKLLQVALVARPELVTRAVMNRDSKTGIAADVAAALEMAGVVVMDQKIKQSVQYPDAMAVGKTVLSYKPSEKAAFEARKFGAEVKRLLDGIVGGGA